MNNSYLHLEDITFGWRAFLCYCISGKKNAACHTEPVITDALASKFVNY